MINDIVNNGYKPATTVLKPATTVAPSPAPQSAKANAKVSEQQQETQNIKDAVTKLNDYVQNIQRTLSFSVDENSGRTVVKVYDSETKELIRQIPSEETLKLAERIDNDTAHLLLQTKV